MTEFYPKVERWRSLVERYVHEDEVNNFLCVISQESAGNPNALFDEWAHNPALKDKSPDSQWSVGLTQVNAGNLAYQRIAGLRNWVPPDWSHVFIIRPTPIFRYTVGEAVLLLKNPENNISAASNIFIAQGNKYAPAWNADLEACGLT